MKLVLVLQLLFWLSSFSGQSRGLTDAVRRHQSCAALSFVLIAQRRGNRRSYPTVPHKTMKTDAVVFQPPLGIPRVSSTSRSRISTWLALWDLSGLWGREG